jgi:hypothetical protein
VAFTRGNTDYRMTNDILLLQGQPAVVTDTYTVTENLLGPGELVNFLLDFHDSLDVT